MDFVEKVTSRGNTLAIIVRAPINTAGVSFFTPELFSQQLAYMQHPAGKTLVAHVHKDVHRAVTKTLEVLFVRKGKLRVDLYDDGRTYIESRVVGAGDVILLVAGGHGFETLESVEMFEVKQGPFAGVEDKVPIKAVSPKEVKIVGVQQ